MMVADMRRACMKEWMATGISRRWRRAWTKEWQRGGACEQQAHGTWPTTTVTAQASTLSRLAYAHPTRPVHASLYPETRATLAQHNYAHQVMHPPSPGAQHNYLDVAPGLEPRTTIQLHGNEMRPRAIHYADDTVLLFPDCPPCSYCYSTTHFLTIHTCSYL